MGPRRTGAENEQHSDERGSRPAAGHRSRVAGYFHLGSPQPGALVYLLDYRGRGQFAQGRLRGPRRGLERSSKRQHTVPHVGQCEALLRGALEACERYYQSFQFVVWAGKSSEDALAATMLETEGQA